MTEFVIRGAELRRATWLQPVWTMQNQLRFIAAYIEAIPSVIPDNIFNSETKAAVEAFQAYFGLSPSGAIDYETWELINYVFQQLCAVKRRRPEPEAEQEKSQP